MTAPPRLAVLADPTDEPESEPALRNAAARWAQQLALPDLTSMHPDPAPPDVDMLLRVTSAGLALHAVRGPEALTRGKPVRIDLHHLDTTTGHGRSLRQPLMRAVGLRKGDPHRPSVLDATAGFGEDAWLLASAGCHVCAVERHPIIAAMLIDAIERAQAHSPSPPRAINVITADSRSLLEHLAAVRAGVTSPTDAMDEPPEVVYIDPMFAPGRKTAERKPMLLLRTLVGGDEDADTLLAPARRAATRRVVVKRARRAEPLAGVPPTATHPGRGVRYDVYAAATD